jgi:ATP-dependent RNA helicase DDX54/DBP10
MLITRGNSLPNIAQLSAINTELSFRLSGHNPTAGLRALLLAPTRELALQTYKVVTEIGKHTDLRSAVLVGGDSMSAQFAEIAMAPDIVVATPGRLLHHLDEVPGFNLRGVRFVVLDEADRLFEMGLGGQVRGTEHLAKNMN